MSRHLDLPQKIWESVDILYNLLWETKKYLNKCFQNKAAACQLNEDLYWLLGPFSTQIFFNKISPLIPISKHTFVKSSKN